jgi:hypothetical protein
LPGPPVKTLSIEILNSLLTFSFLSVIIIGVKWEGKLKAPTTKEGTRFAVAGQPLKTFQRNLKNPLDKTTNLWYNKYSQEGKEPNLVEITQ